MNYYSETDLYVSLFRFQNTFGNGPPKFGIFKSFDGSEGAVGKVENLSLAGPILSTPSNYGVISR